MSGTSGSSYPHCCPRVECPTEKNEIDQLMAGDSHRLNEEEWPTYDATLDENDHDQMVSVQPILKTLFSIFS